MASSTSIERKILDGKKAAETVLAGIREEMTQIQAAGKSLPKLVVILVGENPASQVYTKRKAKVAHELGMLSELKVFDSRISEAELCRVIDALNADASVHAVLIQLPLPAHMDTQRVLAHVDPAKDVDGLHPVNLGKLVTGHFPPALPCTPAGIMTLLQHYQVAIAGKRAVVVGRSTIVGKPMGLLLLQENATVTYCHSKTADLPSVTREGDILVAAVGINRLITADYVKPGAVVVDVGINRTPDGALVGDVDFEAVLPKASLITPVPGGVGPMTIATLMANTVALYKAQGF